MSDEYEPVIHPVHWASAVDTSRMKRVGHDDGPSPHSHDWRDRGRTCDDCGAEEANPMPYLAANQEETSQLLGLLDDVYQAVSNEGLQRRIGQMIDAILRRTDYDYPLCTCDDGGGPHYTDGTRVGEEKRDEPFPGWPLGAGWHEGFPDIRSSEAAFLLGEVPPDDPPQGGQLDEERLVRAIRVVWEARHHDLRSGLTTDPADATLAAAIAREYGRG